MEVGRCDQKGSLLEERKAVGVEALVKGKAKQYEWVAKVLRPGTLLIMLKPISVEIKKPFG